LTPVSVSLNPAFDFPIADSVFSSIKEIIRGLGWEAQRMEVEMNDPPCVEDCEYPYKLLAQKQDPGGRLEKKRRISRYKSVHA
jgi:hypothetical protein